LGMGVLAPWALLRLLPLSGVASGAVGPLRADAVGAGRWLSTGEGAGQRGHDWSQTTAEMGRDAEIEAEYDPGAGAPDEAAAAREGLAGTGGASSSKPDQPATASAPTPGHFHT